MKTIKYILVALSVVFMLSSCEKDIEELRFTDNPTAPVLSQVGDINITSDNLDTGSLTLNWKAADFGLRSEIVYTVVGKNGGNEASLFENIRGTSHVVKYDELKNKLISSLGVKTGAATTISFSVNATVGNGYKVLTSNEISVKATIAE